MTDRYTKIVLTVIAGALVYLCVVMTAFPAVQAQVTQRPGEFTGRPDRSGHRRMEAHRPAADGRAATAPDDRGRHRPNRAHGADRAPNGTADRMVIVGWEENAAPGRPGSLAPIHVVERPPGCR